MFQRIIPTANILAPNWPFEHPDCTWYRVHPHKTMRSRLQNSSYFCVFKYARAVKQKVWNEAENRERDWGETRFARVRLFRHALTISLLILRKKPTVLQSR